MMTIFRMGIGTMLIVIIMVEVLMTMIVILVMKMIENEDDIKVENDETR